MTKPRTWLFAKMCRPIFQHIVYVLLLPTYCMASQRMIDVGIRISSPILFILGIFVVCNIMWVRNHQLPVSETNLIIPVTATLEDKLYVNVFSNNQSTNSEQAAVEVIEVNKPTPKVEKILYGIDIYNISNTGTNRQDISMCVNTRTNPAYKICTYDRHKDAVLSNQIRSKGQWEKHITAMLQRILKQYRNVTVLDIGANIGYFSLLSASLGHYAIAVEPWEQNLPLFAKSIYLNGFQDNIIVFNNAVSNERRIVQLDVQIANSGNPGAATLLSENQIAFDTFPASAIVFDDLADFILTKDIIIKVDIEGHECRALEISDVIFDTFRVLLILIEWGVMKRDMYDSDVACPLDQMRRMTQLLSSRGFVPYGYNNITLDPHNCENWQHWDVFWEPRLLKT